MKTDLLFALGLTFFTTAIFSVGGISAMIPEVHRQVVEVHGWLGNESFATAFALSQIAPGPNILMMSMLGWCLAEQPARTVHLYYGVRNGEDHAFLAFRDPDLVVAQAVVLEGRAFEVDFGADLAAHLPHC
jgi:hypothetical protein